MKKVALSLISILLIFAVIGCNWVKPKAVEIKGKVGIDNLSVNLDLTQFITKELEKRFQWTQSFDIENESYEMEITLQEVVNTSNPLTFLLHLKIPFPISMDDFTFIADIEDQLNEVIDDIIDSFINDGDVGESSSSFDEWLDDVVSFWNVAINDILVEYEGAGEELIVLVEDDIRNEVDKIIDKIKDDPEFQLPEEFDLPIEIPNLADILVDVSDAVIESIVGSLLGNINDRLNQPSSSVVSRNVLPAPMNDDLDIVKDVKEILKEAIVDTIKNETYDAIKDKILTTELMLTEDFSLFNDEIPFPLDDIPEFLLENEFDIPNLAAKVFIAVKDKDTGEHSELLDKFDLTLDLFDNIIIGASTPLTSSESGLIFTDHRYNQTTLPNGGTLIPISTLLVDILNPERKGETLFQAIIPEETVFKLEYLEKNYDLFMEVVLMLPINIKANSRIEFLLTPEDLGFSNDQDLFGRNDSNKLENYIRSINFSIKFNQAILSGVELALEDTDSNFKIPFGIITGREFGCTLTNQQVKSLDQIYPFVPQLRLIINTGADFKIPRNFKIESLNLKVDLSIKQDLKGLL